MKAALNVEFLRALAIVRGESIALRLTRGAFGCFEDKIIYASAWAEFSCILADWDV